MAAKRESDAAAARWDAAGARAGAAAVGVGGLAGGVVGGQGLLGAVLTWLILKSYVGGTLGMPGSRLRNQLPDPADAPTGASPAPADSAVSEAEHEAAPETRASDDAQRRSDRQMYAHYTDRKSAIRIKAVMDAGGAPTPRPGKAFWATIPGLDETDPGVIKSMLGIESADYKLTFLTDQPPDQFGRTRGGLDKRGNLHQAPKFGWTFPLPGHFECVGVEKCR